MLHILPNDQRGPVTAATLAVGLFEGAWRFEGAGRRPPLGRSSWRVDVSIVAVLYTSRA